MQSNPPRQKAFRLHGEIDGVELAYLLPLGTTIELGSHPASDLVLAASGISRRHAVLTAVADGVTVEDRGSKNGTLINSEKIGHATLKVGDLLTLGNVDLRLVTAEPDDARLALAFEPAAQGSGDAHSQVLVDPGETDLVASLEASPRSILHAFVKFTEQLPAADAGALSTALAQLAQSLGLDALAVIAWRGSEEATILGTAGASEDLCRDLHRYQGNLLRGVRQCRDEEGSWRLEVVDGASLLIGLSPSVDGVLGAAARGLPHSEVAGPILRLIGSLYERLQLAVKPTRRPSVLRSPSRLKWPDGYVVGQSRAMQQLYRELENIYDESCPVTILGETGVGKELVAGLLHRSSHRAHRSLVAFNCAAIPSDLLEAEVFGVAQGAATGVSARPGCFARADRGTLFFDELGELKPELQSKLLRALEEGVIQPVGGEPKKVDVRILAATNADLPQKIADGSFRADLYYRLAAAVIEVPPLRNRRDDLPDLISCFVAEFGRATGGPSGLSVHAMQRLMAYPWPGNVRELQHEVRSILRQVRPGQVIDSSHLSSRIRHLDTTPGDRQPDHEPESGGSLVLKKRVADVERRVIAEALARSGGNQTMAAQLLAISRNTLATKVARYGLEP